MSDGTSVRGAHHTHLGTAQGRQGMDVGARHARVQHVAHNGNGQVGKVALEMADGVGIQQALRGVGVTAVTGVDHVHMGGDVLGNQVGRTALAVAHHKNVGSHGRQVGNGVEQAFAFGGRAAGNVEVDDIGAQAGGGNLERGAGAGAVFKKQVEHAFAAQQRHFFDFAVAHRHEVGSGVENVRQDVFGQPFGGQQVNELAIGVELRVAVDFHGVCSANGRVQTPDAAVSTAKLS
jgi:hypothetical protein